MEGKQCGWLRNAPLAVRFRKLCGSWQEAPIRVVLLDGIQKTIDKGEGIVRVRR